MTSLDGKHLLYNATQKLSSSFAAPLMLMGTTLDLERLKSQVLVFYLLWGISCSAKSIPAIFIFGDSLVDVGNNFYRDTNAKAVYPNGIDFGSGEASRRFSNGRLVSDIIAQRLGFQNFTPPCLDPTTAGDVILKGVNYASSGGAIINGTAKIFGAVIDMDEQVSHFAKTRQDIISRIGLQVAQSLIRGSLHFVVIGSNDVTFTDPAMLYPPGKPSSSDAFDDRISRFRVQLTRLYQLDARKIIVAGAGAVGCMPFERDLHPPGDVCVASINQRAQLLNNKLKVLLAELRNTHSKATYVYADIYAMLEDIVENYKYYGFENREFACCRLLGFHGGLYPCVPESLICPDRRKHVFWDAYHPTEAANLIAASHFMDGGLNYMSPMNIRQLLNL